jgi:hypothetical protein
MNHGTAQHRPTRRRPMPSATRSHLCLCVRLHEGKGGQGSLCRVRWPFRNAEPEGAWAALCCAILCYAVLCSHPCSPISLARLEVCIARISCAAYRAGELGAPRELGPAAESWVCAERTSVVVALSSTRTGRDGPIRERKMRSLDECGYGRRVAWVVVVMA